MADGKPGPPEKPINWDLLDNLLVSGCSASEIAPHFNIHPETLYDRVKEKYGIYWTEYSAKMKYKGEALLRATQFAKATGSSTKGDNTMLVWLGKTRLAQRDTPETQTVTEDTLKQFNALMAQFQSAKNAKKE